MKLYSDNTFRAATNCEATQGLDAISQLSHYFPNCYSDDEVVLNENTRQGTTLFRMHFEKFRKLMREQSQQETYNSCKAKVYCISIMYLMYDIRCN